MASIGIRAKRKSQEKHIVVAFGRFLIHSPYAGEQFELTPKVCFER